MSSTNSITVYPFIGGVDDERDGVMDLPDIDTALITVPSGTYATMTNFMSTSTLSGLGWLKVNLAGSAYSIPLYSVA